MKATWLLTLILLAGCANGPGSFLPVAAPAPEEAEADEGKAADEDVDEVLDSPEAVEETVAEAGKSEEVPEEATTVEEFDTTTPEERAVATAAAQAEDAGEERLGTTIASLGNPADPGLWLDTPLVSAERPGRLAYRGETVLVQLRPSGAAPGSGSRISLPAMRLIGAGLTELPEIEVFGR